MKNIFKKRFKNRCKKVAEKTKSYLTMAIVVKDMIKAGYLPARLKRF